MERDPEAVRLDVIRGFVSPNAAWEIYRVVLGPKPDFRVDEAETLKIRQKK